MGTGAGISMLAAGAILYWAVEVDVPFVDDDALGAILMFLGALAIAAAVLLNSHRFREGASAGTGIGLIAAGAILYWAVDVDLPFVYDGSLGVILMVAGLIAFVATIAMHFFNGRSHHTRQPGPYA